MQTSRCPAEEGHFAEVFPPAAGNRLGKDRKQKQQRSGRGRCAPAPKFRHLEQQRLLRGFVGAVLRRELPHLGDGTAALNIPLCLAARLHVEGLALLLSSLGAFSSQTPVGIKVREEKERTCCCRVPVIINPPKGMMHWL